MKSACSLIGITMLVFHMNAGAAHPCGDLEHTFGPYDYTNVEHTKNYLPIVASNHFNKEVENLTRGQTSFIGGDIDYVLHAFPNHYPALNAMAKLGIREHTTQPLGAQYTIECYFDRAIRFKPDDATVRLMYGVYLSRTGKVDRALEQFQDAHKLQPDNANTNYNLGLIYFEKKDYERAKTHAKKAYELGFPLPGLKNKLIAAGQWKEN